MSSEINTLAAARISDCVFMVLNDPYWVVNAWPKTKQKLNISFSLLSVPTHSNQQQWSWTVLHHDMQSYNLIMVHIAVKCIKVVSTACLLATVLVLKKGFFMKWNANSLQTKNLKKHLINNKRQKLQNIHRWKTTKKRIVGDPKQNKEI